MNREEFMKQLEELLSDISQEEREEAISFYNNYFEDAGVENEAQIIKELRSPEKVASSIKADLVANEEYSKNGEYTERGYKDADENKDSIIKVSPSVHEEKQQTEGNQSNNNQQYQYSYNYQADGYSQSTNNQNGYNQNMNNANGYAQNGYNQNANNQYSYNPNGYANAQNSNGYNNHVVVEKKTNVPMLILICIFALPVILPLTLGGFCTVFGLLVGFGAAAVACTISGFVVTIYGLVKLVTVPFFGISAVGGGLIVFGIGILFAMLTVAVSKLLPALCRLVGSIFRSTVTERRVAV